MSEPAYNWQEIAGRIGWDEVRRRFNAVATEQGEWAGVPLPVDGMGVVVANQRQRIAEIWPRNIAPGARGNSWRVACAFNVYLWRDGSETRGTCLNYWAARIDAMMETMRARRAVLPDAEMVAFLKLLDHLDDTQARDYVVSNMFVERGPRSDLLYLFRRGLPILTFRTGEEIVEPRAALCLHPLAYYDGSHAGVLPPSDEVLALLLMMRADEAYLWRKANQLDIRDPLVAI